MADEPRDEAEELWDEAEDVMDEISHRFYPDEGDTDYF